MASLSELEAVFERFYQVDVDDARQHGGAGLGLTICRRIIHSHGGRIWMESPSRGATISFTLPARTTNASAGGLCGQEAAYSFA